VVLFDCSRKHFARENSQLVDDDGVTEPAMEIIWIIHVGGKVRVFIVEARMACKHSQYNTHYERKCWRECDSIQ
jgi:hypothetical protein